MIVIAFSTAFALMILAILWYVWSDIGEYKEEEMHYEEEWEEYIARLHREKEERKKNDKDRPK